jgi:hypothetical protein
MRNTYCSNCSGPKNGLDYNPHCPDCTTIKREAEQHFAAENPGASESDILYAGRQALTQRAHHAHRNFVDPRAFSAQSGMIPTPPDSNRGTPQS